MMIRTKNNNKTWIAVFSIALLIISTVTSCIRGDNNLHENLTLKIYSPTDCIYIFQIEDDSLNVSSINITHSNNKSDSIIQIINTKLDDTLKRQIFNYVKTNSHKLKVESLHETDAYQYELSFKNRTIGRSGCCDSTIRYILKKCMPLINTKELTCSDFFDIVNQY